MLCPLRPGLLELRIAYENYTSHDRSRAVWHWYGTNLVLLVYLALKAKCCELEVTHRHAKRLGSLHTQQPCVAVASACS
jgi:hypothetical protein